MKFKCKKKRTLTKNQPQKKNIKGKLMKLKEEVWSFWSDLVDLVW